MRRTVALLVALTAGAKLAAADSGSRPSEVPVQSDGGKVGKALRSSDIEGYTGLYEHTYGPYATRSASNSGSGSSSSSSYTEPPVSRTTASLLAALGLLLLGSAAVFAFSQWSQPMMGIPPRYMQQGAYGNFGNAYPGYGGGQPGYNGFSPLGNNMGMMNNRAMTPYEHAQLMRKLEAEHNPIRQCASCCNGSSPTHMLEAPEPKYQMVHGSHSGKDLFEPEDSYRRSRGESGGCCSRRRHTCCLLVLSVALAVAGTLTLLATPGSPFYNEEVATHLHTAHKFVNTTAHRAKAHCEETGLCDKAKEMAHHAAAKAKSGASHLAEKARNHLDEHGGEYWNNTKHWASRGHEHATNAVNHANSWINGDDEAEEDETKEVFHRLVPACSLQSDNLLSWYGQPRWETSTARGGEVVCCNKEQTQVFRKEATACISGVVTEDRSSKPLKTFKEAKELCEFADMVLCKSTTLLDSACEEEECGYNRALTWLGGEPRLPLRDAGFGSMDCDEDVGVWQTGWTLAKKAHCCIHGGTSCDSAASEELDFACAVVSNSEWTAAEKAFCCRDGSEASKTSKCHHQFVCDKNDGWETEWSNDKKQYCCEKENLGCPEAAEASEDLPQPSAQCLEHKCSHNGHFGNCAYHIQSIVTFHQAVLNCSAAWQTMILSCPSCRECNFEDSACQNARVAPPASGADDGEASVV